jgi:hypothetical protein
LVPVDGVDACGAEDLGVEDAGRVVEELVEEGADRGELER